MSKRSRYSEAELDLLAMKLRRENLVQMHKNAQEEFKFREMIKAGEKIRNYQNEYGNLYAAHRRLPTGLQGEAAVRVRELVKALKLYRERYPLNFPTGPMPLPNPVRGDRRTPDQIRGFA